VASKVLFDRKWKIELKTSSKSRTIRDLKVTFNIKNTLLGDPSLASFQIYNINEETQAMLSDFTCVISFHAGYYSDNDNDWNVLFTGEVTNCYELRQQTERVWNVWARNSFSLLTQTNPSNFTVVNPISTKAILERLVKDAKSLSGSPLYINNCDKKLLSVEDEEDYSPLGTFSEEFDDLLLKHGLGWQVQQDELVVFDKESTDPGSLEGDAIKVGRETGMLTKPIVDYTGVNFTHLLDGRFRPSKIIEVEPNTIKYNLGNEFYVKQDKTQWRAKGKFRIFEVTHKGDTRGDKWETEVIAFYRRN